ncbi:MAG: hypothetical protein NC548_15760 [Lachnospiraceae bacterium]|nr:hypothetical protein [Lachnospiraceae bacterium]
MGNELTRTEMIELLKSNPYLAFRHELFGDDEYIYFDGVCVRDENNYVFDDWYSNDRNGIRMRVGGNWETGWTAVPHINVKKEITSLPGGKHAVYKSNHMIRFNDNKETNGDNSNGCVIQTTIIKSRATKTPCK